MKTSQQYLFPLQDAAGTLDLLIRRTYDDGPGDKVSSMFTDPAGNQVIISVEVKAKS